MIRRLSDRFWNYLTDRIEARMHLRPSKDNAFDLGSSDYAWRRAYVGPGSASAPSISPAGDPNTGIYQSAADNLDFATGGVRRLNISSAGMSLTGALTLGGLLTLSQGAPLQCNSSYAITVTHSVHTVSAYTQALNYLDTISGGTTGSVLFLRGPASGYPVAVRSGTGNIVLDGAAGFTLANYYHTTLALMKWGATWYELFRMDLA